MFFDRLKKILESWPSWVSASDPLRWDEARPLLQLAPNQKMTAARPADAGQPRKSGNLEPKRLYYKYDIYGIRNVFSFLQLFVQFQWCQSQLSKQFGIAVRDFGKSWRDGNAFLGIVNSIKPGKKIGKIFMLFQNAYDNKAMINVITTMF